MADSDARPSFWTTIPGILTGLAAVLTAGTGLYLAIQHNHTTPADPAPIVEQAPGGRPQQATDSPATTATTPASSVAPPPGTPAGTVTVQSRAGDTTQLMLKSFQHNMTEYALELTSGQTIPFDKIRSISFQSVDSVQDTISVSLTLVDGRSVSGAIKSHYAFRGENDLGPFTIFVQDVKQITFNR